MDFINPINLVIGVLIVVCVVLVRRYLAGGVCRCSTRLNGCTAIITGANTGIGWHTARALTARGARVVLACRDVRAAEVAAVEMRAHVGSDDIVVMKLDLASLQSVREFVREFSQSHKELHILINNAGVCACPRWLSADGYELQLAVNHLGPFLLTTLLLPLLRMRPGSRVINVASIAHHSGTINFKDINSERHYDTLKAYCQSKLANVMFTRELHKRCKGSGVSTFSVHPGLVRTQLARYAPLVISWWKILAWQPVMVSMFKTGAQGAHTSVHCAVAPGLEAYSGDYFSDCRVADTSAAARDERAAQRLWELSEAMTAVTLTTDSHMAQGQTQDTEPDPCDNTDIHISSSQQLNNENSFINNENTALQNCNGTETTDGNGNEISYTILRRK